MKTLSVIVALALATPAFAAPGKVVSDSREGSSVFTSENANEDACFGMGRSYYAGRLAKMTDTSNGTFISERKDINPAHNQQWIEDNCGFEEDED